MAGVGARSTITLGSDALASALEALGLPPPRQSAEFTRDGEMGVESASRAHFTAPAEATSRRAPPGHTPHGDLTDSFVPSDGRANPLEEQSDAATGDSRSGRVVNVQIKPTIETGSLVPEVIHEPVRPGNPGSSPFAKLLSVIRGDKYMANAYPPGWHSAARSTAGHAASSASRTKDR
jgi:hypothetical protein